MNDNRWVNDRLAKLNPRSEWRPNAARALARVRERDRGMRARRPKWIYGTVVASAALAALFLVPVSQACAQPSGVCSQPLWKTVFHKEVAPMAADRTLIAQAAKPAPPAQRAVRTSTPAVRNFKQSGLDSAPLTCEIYTDYECPACAAIFNDTVPMLLAEYVQTGKVKLLHRDFPLPQHKFARLAARYANAAGQLGQYDVAVNQIFKTQNAWGLTGDIDGQLALVLPADIMQKVRDLVSHDPNLDESVETDLAMGRQDHLTQTPSLVVVSKGKRQLMMGPIPYSLIKSYLDELLAAK